MGNPGIDPRAASLRPVLNATGAVVHPDLGRTRLSAAAIDAMLAAAGYTDVDFDLDTGRRGPRGRGALRALAAAVPDAGAVHIVNNGAGALVLAATALAAGREIVVSRRDLAGRVGLLACTGARIREVGTDTDASRADYAAATGPRAAFVLVVVPGAGGAPATPVGDLASLPVPVVAEIGSGLLAADPLLPGVPDATSTLRAGAALVIASADTLLGGPQAGLLLGATALVERARQHPLARALRVDKLTLAALEATLRGPATPTREALSADPEELHERAGWLRDELATAGVKADVIASGTSELPYRELPSWAVWLAEGYAAPLRRGDPPVVGRVEHGRLLLDLRCIPAALDPVVRDAVVAARPH